MNICIQQEHCQLFPTKKELRKSEYFLKSYFKMYIKYIHINFVELRNLRPFRSRLINENA